MGMWRLAIGRLVRRGVLTLTPSCAPAILKIRRLWERNISLRDFALACGALSVPSKGVFTAVIAASARRWHGGKEAWGAPYAHVVCPSWGDRLRYAFRWRSLIVRPVRASCLPVIDDCVCVDRWNGAAMPLRRQGLSVPSGDYR